MVLNRFGRSALGAFVQSPLGARWISGDDCFVWYYVGWPTTNFRLRKLSGKDGTQIFDVPVDLYRSRITAGTHTILPSNGCIYLLGTTTTSGGTLMIAGYSQINGSAVSSLVLSNQSIFDIGPSGDFYLYNQKFDKDFNLLWTAPVVPLYSYAALTPCVTNDGNVVYFTYIDTRTGALTLKWYDSDGNYLYDSTVAPNSPTAKISDLVSSQWYSRVEAFGQYYINSTTPMIAASYQISSGGVSSPGDVSYQSISYELRFGWGRSRRTGTSVAFGNRSPNVEKLSYGINNDFPGQTSWPVWRPSLGSLALSSPLWPLRDGSMFIVGNGPATSDYSVCKIGSDGSIIWTHTFAALYPGAVIEICGSIYR